MIVEGVRVEGFRCFVRPTDVRGFSPSLNIVSAPNGTGKSTLFEAIRRALIDHHTVQGVEAEKMRPWGRSIAPMVSVDFSHASQRYRVQKRFLDAASCDLLRWEVDAYVAVDRGERADEKVRALLSRPTAPKGLSREAHWGLAQVLWAPQGMIELGPLGPELATRVRDTLAAQVVGARGAEIERFVEERFRQFFTPQTLKLKTGRRAPEVVRKDEELALARAAVDRAKERHERTALTQERVGSLRAELWRAEQERAQCEGRLRQCEERLRAFTDAERARVEAALRERECEAQLRASKAASEAWRSARRALEESERAVSDSAIAAAVTRAARDERAREARGAAELEAAAESAHTIKALAESQWSAAQDAARARAASERATAALAALDEAELSLREATDALSSEPLPTERELAELRAAHAALDRSRARLDALSISVELTAIQAVIVIDDTRERAALASGAQVTVRGLGAVELAIEGAVALRVEGPLARDEVERERERMGAAIDHLRAANERWGSDDPSSLGARVRARSERESRVRECAARVKALGGASGREAAERSLREARSTLEQGEAVDSLEIESALAAAIEGVARAGDLRVIAARRRAADRAASEADAALAVAIERSAQREREAVRARSRLEELGREGASEAQSAEATDRALLALDAARAAHATATRALEGRDEIERSRAEITAKFARSSADVQALRDALRTEEGRLDELSQGASYALLAKAEEEVARVDAESSRLHLEAEAVKLLRETLVRCRDEAVARVSGEVERAAERILARIAGLERVRVELGETFAPTRARVGEGEGVALDWLSGGEREQVHFAVRLALAEVLAQEERPMVVLDDVLVATDSARLRRVIEVLEECAERMQVIVLTCHPERYESAKSATRIELSTR